MARVLVVAVLLVALLVISGLLIYWAWRDAAPARDARRQRRRQLAVREQVVLSAEDNHRQLEQAVRLLEKIKDRDEQMLVGSLSEEHRSQADLVIRRFYRDTPGEVQAKG